MSDFQYLIFVKVIMQIYESMAKYIYDAIRFKKPQLVETSTLIDE